MHGITTSIRLTAELRQQLEEAANTMHRGKNWIITQALEDYFHKLNQQKLILEARRQSLLATQSENDKENNFWQDNTDTSGWT
jgi:predicted transcriptional regulator